MNPYVKTQSEEQRLKILFVKFLHSDFAGCEAFKNARKAHKEQKFQQSVHILDQITESTSRSNEEKWLACYLRRMSVFELFKLTDVENEKIDYHIRLIEDELSLNYYSILIEEKESLVFITGNTVENAEPKSKYKKHKKTNAQRKQAAQEKQVLDCTKKAEELMEKGDHVGAIVAYQELIKLDATNWANYIILISIFYQVKSFDDALRIGHAAIEGLEKDTETPERNQLLFYAHYQCGNSYLQLDNPDESLINKASHHFESARRFMPESTIKLNESLINIESSRLRVRVNQASTVRGSRRAEAEESVRQCANVIYDLLIQEAETTQNQDEWDFYRLGETAYFAGNYDTAIKHLQKAIDVAQNLPAYNKLASIYMGQQNYSKAMECYQKILLHLADHTDELELHADAAYQLGMCHEYISSYDEAWAHFFVSIKLYIESDNLVGKSKAMVKMALLEERKCLNEPLLALDKLPIKMANQNLLPLVLAALHAERKTKYSEVIHDLTLLLNTQNSPFLRSNTLAMLGFIYIKEKNPELAVASYEEAISHYPLTSNDQVYFERAKIFVEARTNPSALTRLSIFTQTAVSASPEPLVSSVIPAKTSI